MDLGSDLDLILPLAFSWAEAQSHYILQNGSRLETNQVDLAHRIGVKHPELIRIVIVNSIPTPQNPILKSVCARLNFLGPNTEGLTLHYGIFIKTESQGNVKLLAHEFRHVAQYERYGSIPSYLSVYIPELVEYGYSDAPFEIDAERMAECCV